MSARSDAVDAWEALYRAQVAVQRQILPSLPADLSHSEYDVLYNLFRAPGHASRIRDLHRHLLLTQPSVSRLVERMAVRGLVTKCSDPEDARGTVVSMTPAGVEIFDRAGRAMAQAISDRMLAALDTDQLATLKKLSETLRSGDAPVACATLDE